MRLITKLVAVLAMLLVVAACGDDAADGPDEDRPGEADVTQPDQEGGVELADDVAAVVNGEEISTAQVRAQVDALAGNPKIAEALEGPEGEQTRDVLRAQVVSSLIVNHVAVNGAAELGAPVTDEDVATARAELEEETGGPEGLQAALEQEGMSEDQLAVQLRALAALRNIETALAEDAGDAEADAETRAEEFVRDRLQSAEVVVNDDFGSWNPQSGQVVPVGGVPQPAPAP